MRSSHDSKLRLASTVSSSCGPTPLLRSALSISAKSLAIGVRVYCALYLLLFLVQATGATFGFFASIVVLSMDVVSFMMDRPQLLVACIFGSAALLILVARFTHFGIWTVLATGDLVVVTRLEVMFEGMKVEHSDA